MHDGGSNPHGQITGLTAPSALDYASNKWYTDTAPKYINAALTLGDTLNIAEGSSENQFAVIAAPGVVNTGGKNIFIVSANPTPSWYGRSKTEAHIRGDLQIYGNGLTGSWSGVNFTGHSYATFSVETLQSKVRIRGGGTYPTVGGTVWSPVISFENRAYAINTTEAIASAPIGRIEGLTAPTQEHEAANKWYVDSGRNNINIASNSVTGVAMFDPVDFSVNDEGLVSFIKPFDQLIVTATGSYENPPVSSEIVGVNIKTAQDLISGGTPPYNILSAIAVEKSLGETVSRVNSTTDSTLEVYVNGDFTVFGDGIGANSHTKITFAVDPKLSKATIYGGIRNQGSVRTTPKLSFFQEDVTNAYNAGIIEGLTAPSQNHEAANKWYVENHNYNKSANFGTYGLTQLLPFSSSSSGDPNERQNHIVSVPVSNVDPGVYAINVTLRVSSILDSESNLGVATLNVIDLPSNNTTQYSIVPNNSEGNTQVYATLNIIRRISGTSFRVEIEYDDIPDDPHTITMLSWARLGA